MLLFSLQHSFRNRYLNQPYRKLCASHRSMFLFYLFRFTPSFMRLGTWNIVMFVTFEQLKKLVNEMKEKDEAKSLMQLSAKTRANLAKGY